VDRLLVKKIYKNKCCFLRKIICNIRKRFKAKIRYLFMKKQHCLILLSFLVFCSLSAQSGDRERGSKNVKRNEEIASERAAAMIKEYGFPHNMRVPIAALKLKRMNSAEMAKSSKPINKEALVEVNRAYRTGMKNLLTPQQFLMVQRDWNDRFEKQSKIRARDEEFDMFEDE